MMAEWKEITGTHDGYVVLARFGEGSAGRVFEEQGLPFWEESFVILTDEQAAKAQTSGNLYDLLDRIATEEPDAGHPPAVS